MASVVSTAPFIISLRVLVAWSWKGNNKPDKDLSGDAPRRECGLVYTYNGLQKLRTGEGGGAPVHTHYPKYSLALQQAAVAARQTQRPPCQGVQRKDMPPIAPRRRPFRPHFTYLYRLPKCPKANHFLTYLALLVGPEALSRPVTAQNSLGRGRPPPCAPPCTATRRPAGLRPAGKLRLRRKIEGPQRKTHRT
jgi:hypothetical protein